MKKIYLALVFTICISIPSLLQAQCFPLVPSNAQVIPFGANDSNFFHPGLTHHVCSNAFYYYYGNNPDTIYLDASAILTIGFCQNLTIYMRNNAQLHIDTNTFGLYMIKKIVYDTAYTWLTDTSYATVDSAIACPGMAYNYSNFPGGSSPCFLSIEDPGEESSIKIYPTITSGEIRIETSIEDYEIEVYDLTGRKIISAHNKNLISIGGHSPGIYLVSIHQNGKRLLTEKIFLVR